MTRIIDFYSIEGLIPETLFFEYQSQPNRQVNGINE